MVSDTWLNKGDLMETSSKCWNTYIKVGVKTVINWVFSAMTPLPFIFTRTTPQPLPKLTSTATETHLKLIH